MNAYNQSQSAFVRGFIDGRTPAAPRTPRSSCLNPRSCAASSMARPIVASSTVGWKSQSAFVRGFIDGGDAAGLRRADEGVSIRVRARLHRWRGMTEAVRGVFPCLNPRSCAASSMAHHYVMAKNINGKSQSAFVRGFIDGESAAGVAGGAGQVSIRVRARLHRWLSRPPHFVKQPNCLNPRSCAASSMAGVRRRDHPQLRVSIRVRARLHRWRRRVPASQLGKDVSIRVRARLHRWHDGARAGKNPARSLNPRSCAASSMATMPRRIRT